MGFFDRLFGGGSSAANDSQLGWARKVVSEAEQDPTLVKQTQELLAKWKLAFHSMLIDLIQKDLVLTATQIEQMLNRKPKYQPVIGAPAELPNYQIQGFTSGTLSTEAAFAETIFQVATKVPVFGKEVLLSELLPRFASCAERSPLGRFLLFTIATSVHVFLYALERQPKLATRPLQTAFLSLLNQFHPLGGNLFFDALDFCSKRSAALCYYQSVAHPSPFGVETSAGVWLIWNLMGQTPRIEDCKEGGLVGTLLCARGLEYFEFLCRSKAG